MGIVRKYDGGIAVVVDFSLSLLPTAVSTALLKSHAQQLTLLLGNCLEVFDTYRNAILFHRDRRLYEGFACAAPSFSVGEAGRFYAAFGFLFRLMKEGTKAFRAPLDDCHQCGFITTLMQP